MRSRILSKLTEGEIEQYLEKNDIIFVPVGVTEMHGGLPADCETVVSEAFALKMAEKVDGLVLTNLPYFYAGATASGKATIQVSVRSGIDYLMEIARCLLKKGFKRQVYISLHGPAHITCSALVRDFFDETKNPIFYLDMMMGLNRVMEGGLMESLGDVNNLFFAGYEVMGRLDDIPLTSELPVDHSQPWEQTVKPFDSFLSQYAYQSGGYGYYFGDMRDHAPTPRVDSPEQRKEYADKGVVLMDKIVEALDIPQLVEKLRDVDTFTQEVVIPRSGDCLP